MKRLHYFRPVLFCGAICFSSLAFSVPIVSSNLDDLDLGATIVGPVGPEVETTLLNGAGQGIGDLISSVSCPTGFMTCLPPSNPAGTLYTYVHQVIPGVDLPNDAPFPNPPDVIPFDNVGSFSLGFTAYGFNGVAGVSFSQANAANVSFDIDLSDTGLLTWNSNSDDWDSGEVMTFFWQTTQAPSGPGGQYLISDNATSGSGAGPLPIPIMVAEPSVIYLSLIGLILVYVTRKRNGFK